ncbi:hypothetical protein M0R45_021603 [Rubus argutus]|uniref:Uncharacterized protein n=1 Tax=Rubus argutus TaxID=59490 RepID=A0AAW1XD42_RUBAR
MKRMDLSLDFQIAVDAHTGTHLFKKCLLQHLSQKTVIYATHQLEFLEAADIVLVIKGGQIAQSGKYEDLIADLNGELVRQMAAHRKSLDQVSTYQQDDSFNSRSHHVNLIEVVEEKGPFNNGKLPEKSHEEEAETGRVKWSVYSTFVTSAYGGAVFLATIAIQTAQNLFLGMITSVFRAPISFFDSTPSSRILNRSSTDQSTADMDIPYRLAGLAFALIQLISIMVLMSQVAWQVFLLFLAVLALSIWYQAYYITTARELARMVGIRKAPILHHFSESITGAATIRCFNQENRFLMKIMNLTDDYSRVAFHNYATMEWLSVRINFLFNLVFFLVLIILVSLPRSAIDPSLAGLAATYGLNLNVLQAWQHSDQEIWEVLNECRLAEIVRQDQRLLDAPVAEGGENWSVGQRQLVCLARVLLKKRRILVLDEATASIDTATDIVIQETIRGQTNGCTVITVAHRIPTVIDNDLVLVLDEGKVLEYDSPARLLEDGSSAFSKLVAEYSRRSSMINCFRDLS